MGKTFRMNPTMLRIAERGIQGASQRKLTRVTGILASKYYLSA
jgi:hypothetical protein